MEYLEINILDKVELKLINDQIKNGSWENGLKSTRGYTEDTKKNKEMNYFDGYDIIRELVMRSLYKNKDFCNICIPLKSSGLIISNMEDGDYYNIHMDDPTNGHYSTTVFLSNPNDYEGGELCLYENGEEKRIKPSAGTAVVYNTGIVHRVNKVTKGQRKAAVLWTESKFDDSEIRKIYSKLERLRDILPKKIVMKDYEDCINNPTFIIDDIQSDIVRKFMKQFTMK